MNERKALNGLIKRGLTEEKAKQTIEDLKSVYMFGGSKIRTRTFEYQNFSIIASYISDDFDGYYDHWDFSFYK